MKRMMCMALVVSMTAVVGAQKHKPKPCAIYVSADGTGIVDPAHASCQAGGKLAVVFCNDDSKPHSFTLKKDMKDPSGISYAVLKADVSPSNPVKRSTCEVGKGQFSDDGTVFGATIPYTFFIYSLLLDGVPYDPDLDVSPPTGLELKAVARARGAR